MKPKLAAVMAIAFVTLTGNAADAQGRTRTPVELSGPVNEVQQIQGDGMLPLIGIVADSGYSNPGREVEWS